MAGVSTAHKFTKSEYYPIDETRKFNNEFMLRIKPLSLDKSNRLVYLSVYTFFSTMACTANQYGVQLDPKDAEAVLKSDIVPPTLMEGHLLAIANMIKPGARSDTAAAAAPPPSKQTTLTVRFSNKFPLSGRVIEIGGLRYALGLYPLSVDLTPIQHSATLTVYKLIYTVEFTREESKTFDPTAAIILGPMLDGLALNTTFRAVSSLLQMTQKPTYITGGAISLKLAAFISTEAAENFNSAQAISPDTAEALIDAFVKFMNDQLKSLSAAGAKK